MSKRLFWTTAVLAFVVLTSYAWTNRFVQDDAFISFRYADNLAHGKGLVWNEGERVEGYTNFLWVILISVGIRLGFEPIIFSQALGMTAFVCCLLFTYAIAQDILESRELGLLTTILLGANFTFSSFATGGLETALHATLVTASTWLGVRCTKESNLTLGRLGILSTLLALSMLARPDSVLFVSVIVPAVIRELWRYRGSYRRFASRTMWLTGPLISVVGIWLLWKVQYYGDVLPNTFYAKAVAGPHLLAGLRYVASFLQSYWLGVFVLLGIVALATTARQHRKILILFLLTTVWAAYVIWIGGDFMEFRVLVPILPVGMIIAVWLAVNLVRQEKIQILLVVMALLGSVNHGTMFPVSARHPQSVHRLQAYLWDEGENWVLAGQRLGEYFFDSSGVVIATTASGAIPYYSGLTTVDMLGLNDRWVARHGLDIGWWGKPGHQRLATLHYLVERKVNLVIGHPQVLSVDALPSSPAIGYCKDYLHYFTQIPYACIAEEEEALPDTSIVAIPLTEQHSLMAWYLTGHPAVDKVISAEGWRVFPVRNQECKAKPAVGWTAWPTLSPRMEDRASCL